MNVEAQKRSVQALVDAINGLKRGRNPHVVKVRDGLLEALGFVCANSSPSVCKIADVISQID